MTQPVSSLPHAALERLFFFPFLASVTGISLVTVKRAHGDTEVFNPARILKTRRPAHWVKQ